LRANSLGRRRTGCQCAAIGSGGADRGWMQSRAFGLAAAQRYAL